MSSVSRRFQSVLLAAFVLAACGSARPDDGGELRRPQTGAAPTGTALAPVEVSEGPPPGSAGISGEQVLLVRQTDGETSRMFTVRADGSGEQEFQLPAPCDPDDRGCTIRMVLPSVNGRSLIVALEHLYWYDVATGDLAHIAHIDDVRVDQSSARRFVVAATTTDEGSMLLVVDREAGTTFETPFAASIQVVAELSEGVLVRDQRGPTVIVNTVSGSVATIDDGLLVGPDQVSADGELIAAVDVRGEENRIVMIDVADPSSPSPWPPRELDFAFDWAGEQLVTVTTEDGVVQLVDEFGAVELGRLWPGEFRSPSVNVDPTGAYALVNVSAPEDVQWFRVDIDAQRVDQVDELRGLELSHTHAHTDKGLIWVTDAVDDDGRYTRLVAAPISPGPIVEVWAAERATTAAVWALGDHHVFVRSFPHSSAPETRWVVDLKSAESVAVTDGAEPRLSIEQSTVAMTARHESKTWIVLMPLEDPTAATNLIDGTAIDWIER